MRATGEGAVDVSEVLRWVTNVTFVLASLAALRLFLRHRSPATVWLLATFAAIDLVLLVSTVAGEPTGLVQRAVVVVLLAVPYCLFRFADAIVPARRVWRLGTQVLYGLVVALTLLLPELDAENAMESGDPLLTAWLLLALLLWFAPELAAGWLLARASVGEPGVVRSRLRVLAVACVGLGAYIPITSFVGEPSTAFDVGSRLVLITLGLLFVVGFAPPDLLKSAWREQDERRLYEAAVALMGARVPEDVAQVVVPGARVLMGAPCVVMRDADGHVMARAGQADADVRVVREVRTHAIGDATLELTVAPTMPVFGSDETQHLDRLALLAELALDRVRLLEAERAARDDVERLNAELESFVYTTSHDLKNPLIAMLGYLDVVAEEYGPGMTPDMQHIFGRMQVNARHMDSLIRDLLELSRVGRVDVAPERVDLESLVDDLGRDLTSSHPEAHVVRGALPTLWMNPTRARQLFTNLFDNAVAYGGRADVTIRVEALPHADGGTRLVVRDDGQGIDPEHLERVFGVFERLDPDHTTGTGMGLAICRRVVEHLGGTMQAAPSTDGAVFHIDLPAATILVEDPAPAVTLEGSTP
jgi:signal transduction histidine kinase